MTGEFPNNDESEFQAQPGGLLERTQQVAATQAAAETAPVAEPEVPKGGLMERIDEVSKRQDAELAPESSERDEVSEITPETAQILVGKLSVLQQRIASIPIELGAQEYKYQVGKTIQNLINEVGPNHPSEPSPSAELFR